MRVAYDGSAAVYTRRRCMLFRASRRALRSPFSSVFLWTTGNDVVNVHPPPRPFPAFSLAMSPVLSCQDAWFMAQHGEEGPPLLVVAWSTDFVHP
eukprot:6636115-Prymnesium_polylepis.1